MSVASDCIVLNDNEYCKKQEKDSLCDQFIWYKTAVDKKYINEVNSCVAKIKLPDHIVQNSQFKGKITNNNMNDACTTLFEDKFYETGSIFVKHFTDEKLCVIVGNLDENGKIIMPDKKNEIENGIINTKIDKGEWVTGSRICKPTDPSSFPCINNNKFCTEEGKLCTESQASEQCKNLQDCSYLYKKNIDGNDHFYFRRTSDIWMPDDNGYTMYIY